MAAQTITASKSINVLLDEARQELFTSLQDLTLEQMEAPLPASR